MYEELLPHWDFLDATYTGGRAWFNELNIFRYHKEGEIEYGNRRNRAYRFNHSREVVDLVNKYLFRAPIHRKVDQAPPKLAKFWKKATLSGLDMTEFAKLFSTRNSTTGTAWIVVDSDVEEIENATDKDVEDFNGPYAYIVKPQDALDMAFDEKGELLWFLCREYKRDDETPGVSSGTVEERFRLWTREKWFLYERAAKSNAAEVKYRLKESGNHDLGRVPVEKADHAFTTDHYSAPALIADIAYLDRACANYASNLDAIIQDQTFSQLAMPAQGVLPGDDAYNMLLSMGTKRVFLYDGEGGVAPQYLSPNPSQAQLILSAIGQLINEIYHSVGLAGERTKQDNSKGIDNSSGVAKERDFERVVALLHAKAQCLETTENRIARLVCLWNGEEYPEDLVAYSETFDVRTLADEIEMTMSMLALEAPESVLAAQLSVVITKMFPDLGSDLIEKMKSDVVAWAKERKENFEALAAVATETGGLLEDSRRDRADAGKKQSKTKQQATAAQ